MATFLDKIFSSKIEVDLAKIDLEAALSFQDMRVDTVLAKHILEGTVGEAMRQDYFCFLGKMAVLEETVPLTIAEELQLLTHYLKLCEKCDGSPIFVRSDIRMETDKSIAPLLTFPLVANALRYGYNSMVIYPLKVKIRALENMLLIEVSNRVNHHMASQENTSIISRYKNRLLSVYPNRHTLLFNSNSNTFKAYLQLHW